MIYNEANVRKLMLMYYIKYFVVDRSVAKHGWSICLRAMSKMGEIEFDAWWEVKKNFYIWLLSALFLYLDKIHSSSGRCEY